MCGYVCVCVFEKIADVTTTKAMWDTLVSCYDGDALVNKVKLQSMYKKYENLNMKDNEKVPQYTSRVIVVTNDMKACGETLSELVIIDKVLRSLTPQLDYMVVAIEHSKDTRTTGIEELQSSLNAQELRQIERNSKREFEQALKASSNKKYQKQTWLEANKRHSNGSQKSEGSKFDEKKHHKGNGKFDNKKV